MVRVRGRVSGSRWLHVEQGHLVRVRARVRDRVRVRVKVRVRVRAGSRRVACRAGSPG